MIVGVLLVGCVWSVRGQADGIEVGRPDTSAIETDPGEVVSISFRVVNTGAEERSLEAQLDLPDGWQPVISPGSFTVEGGEEAVQFTSISVPGAARAGRYSAGVQFVDTASEQTAGSLSIDIIVAEVYALELQHIKSPRFVVSGQRYQSVFQLSNTGNTPGKISLSVESSESYIVRLDSTALRLGPGQSRSIPVEVQIPEETDESGTHTVRLTARVSGENPRQDRASGSTEVVLRQRSVRTAYRRVPFEGVFRTGGTGRELGGQFEGRGSVDFGGSSLEYIARTPVRGHRSSFMQRPFYQLSYLSDSWELTAGDHTYSLTNLTERSIYGIGGGGSYAGESWAAGAYAQQPRYTTYSDLQIAGYTRFQPSSRWSTSLNYLMKQGRDAGNTVTMQTTAEPFELLNLEAEVGVTPRVNVNSYDRAYRASVGGRRSWFSYNARYLHADEDFTGEYDGYDHGRVGTSLRLSPSLRLDGTYTQSLRRIELLDETNTRESSHLSVSGRYENLRIRYRQSERFEAGSIDQRERSIDADWSYQGSWFRIRTHTSVGRRHYRLEDQTTQFQQYRLDWNLRIASQRVGVYGSYATDGNQYTADSEHRYSAGLSSALRLFGSTTLDLTLSQDWSQSAQYVRLSNYFDTRLNHTFSWGHQLSIRFREYIRGNVFDFPWENRRTNFTVDYTVPLQIPYARDRTVGQLEGRLVDHQTDRGIPGVLVRVDDRAVVTGEDGTFALSGLSAGPHNLQVDSRTLGSDRVIMQSIPVEVRIQGGQTRQITLTANQSASLFGRVIRYEYPDDISLEERQTQAPEPAGGVNGVVIRLRSETEESFRVTGADGRFRAEGLRPGTWQVRVARAPVSDRYETRTDTASARLGPGAVDTVRFEIMPRGRQQLQIVQEETLTLDDDTTDETAEDTRETVEDSEDAPPVPTDEPEAAAPADTTSYSTYVVQPGDRGLMDIARNVYDAAHLWSKIWLANREAIEDPGQVEVGQTLRIPPKAPLTPEEEAAKQRYYDRVNEP